MSNITGRVSVTLCSHNGCGDEVLYQRYFSVIYNCLCFSVGLLTQLVWQAGPWTDLLVDGYRCGLRGQSGLDRLSAGGFQLDPTGRMGSKPARGRRRAGEGGETGPRCPGEDRCRGVGGGGAGFGGHMWAWPYVCEYVRVRVCEIRVLLKQTSTGGSLSLGEHVKTAEMKPLHYQSILD